MIAYAAFTLLLSLGLALSGAEWALRYQRQRIEGSDRMAPGMILYDATLGWRLAPGWSGRHHNYDFDVEYHINRYGFRGPNVAPLGAAPTTVVTGDSFTFGLGVGDDQTFVRLLNGGDEIYLNLAVPGYSTDQEYLQIRDRLGDLRPDRLLLVVYLANDLVDNLGPYPMQAEMPKPYFDLEGNGELTPRNIPVPRRPKPAAARSASLARLVLGDQFQRPRGPAGWLARRELCRRTGLLQARPHVSESALATRLAPALRLFMALLRDARVRLEARGTELVVALLAGRSHVRRPESLSAHYQEWLRERVGAALGAEGIPVIDVAGQMRRRPAGEARALYYPNEGHLTPDGHRAVAELLRAGLHGSAPPATERP